MTATYLQPVSTRLEINQIIEISLFKETLTYNSGLQLFLYETLILFPLTRMKENRLQSLAAQ